MGNREPCDVAIGAHTHAAKHVPEHAEGIRGTPLVEPVGDQRGLGAEGGQLARDAERPRRRVRVAEGARVGVDRGEQVDRDGRRDRQIEGADQIVDHLARGGRRGIDPVDGAVAPIVGMVIDIEHRAVRRARGSQQPLRALVVRAVREDDHVVRARGLLPHLPALGPGEKGEGLRHRMRPGQASRTIPPPPWPIPGREACRARRHPGARDPASARLPGSPDEVEQRRGGTEAGD